MKNLIAESRNILFAQIVLPHYVIGSRTLSRGGANKGLLCYKRETHWGAHLR